MDKITVCIIIALIISIAITIIIALIAKKDKPYNDLDDIYSVNTYILIDSEQKAQELTDVISTYCTDIQYETLKRIIKTTLENES